MFVFDTRWTGPHGIGRFAREIYRRVPSFTQIALHGNPAGALEPLRLTIYLRQTEPDLYFSPGYNCPIGNPCPFIFCLHDLNHLHAPRASARLKQLYYFSIILPAIRNSQAVITVSQFSKEAICDWAGVSESQVINVGNGVAQEFGPDGPAKSFGSRPYFLYVGNSKPHKNLPRIMRAFAISGLWTDFDLIAATERTAELTALADSYSITRYMRFLHRVSDDDLAALYRGAQGLLFVSLYEGFGLPLLESMACGTPVVTSSAASMPEVAGDAALIVDPYDVDAIADAMKKLASDQVLRQSLRVRGLERAKKYSWDATALRVQSILTSYRRCM